MATAPTFQPMPSAPNLFRVEGEDAPWWLAAGFAAIGLPMMLAAGFLLAGAQAPPTIASAPAPARVTRPQPVAQLIAEPITKPIAPPETSQVRQVAGEAPPLAPAPPDALCLPVVSIPFAHKSARPILEGVESRLEPLIEWLSKHPDAMLLVEGHADPRGGEAYNVVLSYSRAQAVVAWLSGAGVDRKRMTSRAAGTALPGDPELVVADNRMALVQVAGAPICRKGGARE